jgi:hypothetical protein
MEMECRADERYAVHAVKRGRENDMVERDGRRAEKKKDADDDAYYLEDLDFMKDDIGDVYDRDGMDAVGGNGGNRSTAENEDESKDGDDIEALYRAHVLKK